MSGENDVLSGVGADRARVAQIVRYGPDGKPEFGSGYLLTESYVLTAAHVVKDAHRVGVRTFGVTTDHEHGGVEVSATIDILLPAIDIALLRTGPADHLGHPVPARFGRIGESAAALHCDAVGFPRFKTRDTVYRGEAFSYRDSHDARGEVRLLSNLRDRTLEIVVAPPDRRAVAGESPWAGMSGAAVFCHRHIVGVVSRHDRFAPLACLTATRVERWYDECGAAPAFARFRRAVGLPGSTANLPDVVGQWRRSRVEAALKARDYDGAIAMLGQAVHADALAASHHGYLFALALLRGLAPSRHRYVEEMRRHLGAAVELPHARALHLLVEEDYGAAGARGVRPDVAAVRRLVDAVPPARAREICEQITVPSSVVWRALLSRGRGEPT